MKRRGPVKQHPNGKWGYDLRIVDPATGRRTRRVRVFEFETRREAELAAAVLQLADRDARHGIPAPQVSPLLADLIQSRVAELPNTREGRRAARILRTWLNQLPVGIRVESIATAHVRVYVDRRAADGLSPASINRELNVISGLLRTARDRFPVLARWIMPKIPRPRAARSRRERIITDDEARRILAALQRPQGADDSIRYQGRMRAALIFRFALLTGARPGEIHALKWEDIDHSARRIRIRGTKTAHLSNSVRYVPITTHLAEILAQRQAAQESPVYVFSLSGIVRHPDYARLREACEVAGIPYGRTRNGLDLYCARHTFTTRLLQAGLSLHEVAAVTGHSDREMVLYYSHITPESTARTVSRLEEIERERIGEGKDFIVG
jgi:integrase